MRARRCGSLRSAFSRSESTPCLVAEGAQIVPRPFNKGSTIKQSQYTLNFGPLIITGLRSLGRFRVFRVCVCVSVCMCIYIYIHM